LLGHALASGKIPVIFKRHKPLPDPFILQIARYFDGKDGGVIPVREARRTISAATTRGEFAVVAPRHSSLRRTREPTESTARRMTCRPSPARTEAN